MKSYHSKCKLWNSMVANLHDQLSWYILNYFVILSHWHSATVSSEKYCPNCITLFTEWRKTNQDSCFSQQECSCSLALWNLNLKALSSFLASDVFIFIFLYYTCSYLNWILWFIEGKKWWTLSNRKHENANICLYRTWG